MMCKSKDFSLWANENCDEFSLTPIESEKICMKGCQLERMMEKGTAELGSDYINLVGHEED